LIGFERLPLARGASAHESRWRAPASHAFFEGHFSGNPVLPAAAQLWLVHELACERAGERLGLLGLAGVRLRRRIAPNEELELRLEDAGRFELRAAGELATHGSLELARAAEDRASTAPLALEAEAGRATRSAQERPAWTRCLPHAPPALVLGELLEQSEDSVACRLELAPASGWRVHARGAALSGLLAVEAGAQAAALHLGLALARAQEPPVTAGFLVALRAARFDPAGIPAAPAALASTLVRARRLESAPPLSTWSFELEQAGRALASGRFSAWQAGNAT